MKTTLWARWAVVALGAGVMMGTARGADTPTATEAPKAADGGQIDEATRTMIDSLVDELANGDNDAAADARKQLIQLGPVAKGRLVELQKETKDGRMRMVLRQVMAEIDASAPPVGKMEQATVKFPLNPPPISLDLKGATLDVAMGELAKVTEVPYSVNENNGGRRGGRFPELVANIHLEKVSFAEAADGVGDAYGGQVQLNEGNLRFDPNSRPVQRRGADRPRPGGAPAGDEGAPARLALTMLTRNQQMNFGGEAGKQEQFIAVFDLRLDPRIRVAGQPRVTLEEAVDDKGHNLRPDKAPMRMMGYGGMGRGMAVQVELKYPDRDAGERIAKLKGNVAMEAITEATVLTIADATQATNQKAEIGGARYTIVSLTPGDNGRRVEVRLVMENLSMKTEQWRQYTQDIHQTMARSLTVTDAKGRVLRSQGGGGGGPPTRLEYTFNYGTDNGEAMATPLSLRLELPNKTEMLTIPFDLSDLPMP